VDLPVKKMEDSDLSVLRRPAAKDAGQTSGTSPLA